MGSAPSSLHTYYKANAVTHSPLTENWTRLEAKEDFLRIVCQEKQYYYQKRVDAIKSDQNLTEYEIIRLHKFGPAIEANPLVIDGKSILNNLTKKAHSHRAAS